MAKRSPIFLFSTTYQNNNNNNNNNNDINKSYLSTSIDSSSSSRSSPQNQTQNSPQNPIFRCIYRRSDSRRNSLCFQQKYTTSNEQPTPNVDSPEDSLQTGEDDVSVDEGYEMRRDLENQIRLAANKESMLKFGGYKSSFLGIKCISNKAGKEF